MLISTHLFTEPLRNIFELLFTVTAQDTEKTFQVCSCYHKSDCIMKVRRDELLLTFTNFNSFIHRTFKKYCQTIIYHHSKIYCQIFQGCGSIYKLDCIIHKATSFFTFSCLMKISKYQQELINITQNFHKLCKNTTVLNNNSKTAAYNHDYFIQRHKTCLRKPLYKQQPAADSCIDF